MLAHVITLHFNSVTGSFDDSPLQDFLKDKDVLSLREHFFVQRDVPYLAVFVSYHPMRPETATPASKSKRQPDTSWRELVSEVDLPVFNTLRDWRAERSKQDGVPPYVICTNRQLAVMLKDRPQSLTALTKIDGFGQAKVEKYGRDLLALLAKAPERHHQTPRKETGNGAAPQ